MGTDMLIVLPLLAFGVWYIVGRAVISQAIREAIYAGNYAGPTSGFPRFLVARRLFVDLIECPGCTGVWTGILSGAIFKLPWTMWIVGGLFFCTTNLILFHLTGLDRPPPKE